MNEERAFMLGAYLAAGTIVALFVYLAIFWESAPEVTLVYEDQYVRCYKGRTSVESITLMGKQSVNGLVTKEGSTACVPKGK